VATQTTVALKIMPLGVFDRGARTDPALLPPVCELLHPTQAGKSETGAIEITLPNGVPVCLDAGVTRLCAGILPRAAPR
jgi:hypothetical protein